MNFYDNTSLENYFGALLLCGCVGNITFLAGIDSEICYWWSLSEKQNRPIWLSQWISWVGVGRHNSVKGNRRDIHFVLTCKSALGLARQNYVMCVIFVLEEKQSVCETG